MGCEPTFSSKRVEYEHSALAGSCFDSKYLGTDWEKNVMNPLSRRYWEKVH